MGDLLVHVENGGTLCTEIFRVQLSINSESATIFIHSYRNNNIRSKTSSVNAGVRAWKVTLLHQKHGMTLAI